MAYLLVKLFNTLGEDNSIHAYNLKEEAESKFLVLNVFELLDYHPLDGCMPFDDRKFVRKVNICCVMHATITNITPRFTHFPALAMAYFIYTAGQLAIPQRDESYTLDSAFGLPSAPSMVMFN